MAENEKHSTTRSASIQIGRGATFALLGVVLCLIEQATAGGPLCFIGTLDLAFGLHRLGRSGRSPISGLAAQNADSDV